MSQTAYNAYAYILTEVMKVTRDYKKAITRLLRISHEPMDVEKIRLRCSIGNWNTALKHCLELQHEGKIKGTRTSRGWIFWINKMKQSMRNLSKPKKGGE